MKNTYKILPIILMVITFSSCKNDPIMFDKSKTFVAFAYSSVSVTENSNSIDLPLMVAAVKGSPSVTVNYEVSTEGISNPAIEGTDYTIDSEGLVSFPDGMGYAAITIHPIDNDQFTGNKAFKLVITSNSKGYANGALSEMTVTLKDDEHPLAKWIGSYVVSAVSYASPGDYDETWAVTTEPDENDVNSLLISGVAGSELDPIKATINLEEMTITFAPGQSIGDVYGYGNIAVYKGAGAGDDVVLDEPLTGTISEDGTILIDLWGELITDGQYQGYLWDVFNTSWIKQ